MSEPFISYAQNGEDVVLWRALRGVRAGCYVDVGALHPEIDSVTKAFYDRGWRGLNIEPVPAHAAEIVSARPDDEVLQAAITRDSNSTIMLHHVVDTGLSTISDDLAEGYLTEGRQVVEVEVPTSTLADAVAASSVAGQEVHFLKVDVEGAEADVLATVDLASWRPWILVIEATLPNSAEVAYAEWESQVLGAGYEFCLFDGLNRFYVAEEHADLRRHLSYPACPLDDYQRADYHRVNTELERVNHELEVAWRDLARWRHAALQTWAVDINKGHHEVEAIQKRLTVAENQLSRARVRARENGARATELERLLDEFHGSVSWKVTKPLRSVRSRQLRFKGRD